MKLKSQTPTAESDHLSSLPLVLILGADNSCRSQMAEGLLRTAAGEFLEVASAGSRPSGFVHPLAVKVMAEIGIDVSAQSSKSVNEFLFKPVEILIVVCETLPDACPLLTKVVRQLHWPFDNPADSDGSVEERLESFRRLRDQMRPVFEAYAAGNKDGYRGRPE